MSLWNIFAMNHSEILQDFADMIFKFQSIIRTIFDNKQIPSCDIKFSTTSTICLRLKTSNGVNRKNPSSGNLVGCQGVGQSNGSERQKQQKFTGIISMSL